MLFTFKVLIIILSVFKFHGSTKSGAPTSGPFRSYLVNGGKCKKPTYPLHPKPTIILEVEIFNTTEGTAMRGTFEVLNYTTNAKLKVKSLIWNNGKWRTNFISMDNGCRGSFMPFVMSFFNIQFDKKKCAFLKCKVPFEIINTNKVHHFMSSTAEYGRVMYVAEMIVTGKQYKTLYCYEYETIVEPA